MLVKSSRRRLPCFAVAAHVGDGASHCRAAVLMAAKPGWHLQSGEEVFLHVADEVFDTAFFVGFAHVAGAGLEPVVGGEVEVARMEHGLFCRRDG